MQVIFLINKGVKALFSGGGKKGANFLNEGQEGCYFVNLRAGRVQHPPETVWGKLCRKVKYRGLKAHKLTENKSVDVICKYLMNYKKILK